LALPSASGETNAPDAESRGHALDPRYYLGEKALDRDLEAIFSRTWQYAGHVADLAEPNTYVTTVAGDQPVLVVRTDTGELHAYRNVCRHRGSELLTGSGTCKRALRCRYHGWTYDSADGRLLGVPEHRSFDALDKPSLGLIPARVEVLAGFVFVNLDPDTPALAELTRGLEERLARYRIAELVPFDYGDPGESSQPANWKIVVENYLEGYHVPIAHPGLMRLFDYQRYTVTTHGGYAWFEAPLRDAPSSNRIERLYQRLAKPMRGLDESDRRVWRYVLIYPNTAIDLYPDQVNIWQIAPNGTAATTDRWASLREAHPGPVTRFVQRINQRLNNDVLAEDVDLVKAVQTGIRSRGYAPGPLSAREAGVAWFADKVREDLEHLA
jgi:phenylpropionate dioxygenase-like ring-hydroxylating dioxygenase large terminal subunit